jgi:ATP-dependent DNA helicase RecG
LKTVVAFANTAGGTLLIGVEDRVRNARGVADPLDEEERLANLTSDRISPRFVPEIEILPWRQTHVLALQEHPSPSRPHHLIREGPAAGQYLRVGSTNRRADAELVEEPRRFSRGEGFDEQPLPGLGSEAIAFRAASESFAPFRALRQRDLETLRLVSDHQGQTVPTVGGLILFGHDHERYFPDAWIQAGRIAGSDKSRILDRIEIHSFPVQAVEEAIAFVQKHSWHGASIGAVHRADRCEIGTSAKDPLRKYFPAEGGPP